jgi:type IV pilus assembly protein PilE
MNGLRDKFGFTLLELLVVVAIIGILAAFAYPSYMAYILRSRRTEGVATLSSIQLQQEKYRTYNATYGSLASVWNGVTTTDNGYYNLAISNGTATGYTATATAQGNQANDSQAGVSCSVLTLTVNGLNTTQTPAACWAR